MGVQEDSLVINFKSNSNFEQCDLIFPPSYSSSLAMISMEMHPKGQVDDAMGVQEDSLIINFKLNLQFEQCDSVLPPSPRSSPAYDVNGDAAANAHPMQRDSARFGHSVEIFFCH